MIKWYYSMTDLYGGERNYSWVKKGEVMAENERQALRRARKELGYSGVRGEPFDFDSSWIPRGACVVLDVFEGDL